MGVRRKEGPWGVPEVNLLMMTRTYVCGEHETSRP